MVYLTYTCFLIVQLVSIINTVKAYPRPQISFLHMQHLWESQSFLNMQSMNMVKTFSFFCRQMGKCSHVLWQNSWYLIWNNLSKSAGFVYLLCSTINPDIGGSIQTLRKAQASLKNTATAHSVTIEIHPIWRHYFSPKSVETESHKCPSMRIRLKYCGDEWVFNCRCSSIPTLVTDSITSSTSDSTTSPFEFSQTILLDHTKP